MGQPRRSIGGVGRSLCSLVLLALRISSSSALSPTANEPTPKATQHAVFFAHRVVGYLTTRDGVELRYSALLPDGPGPFPSILNYSGYDPGAIGGVAYLADNTAMSVNLDQTLVSHGYAVVGVNARGTGCSEGQFDFLGPDYGRDGADAIEFIATQPWSDGAVGMANWSWAGMSQLATAIEQPVHLKAIAPGMTVGDIRLDSWAPGGVPAPAFVAGWWLYLQDRWDSVAASATHEGDTRCVSQVERNRETAEINNLSHKVIQHPLRDPYIEARHLAAKTAKITVPVLSMTAFQDEAVTSRDGHYQDTLDPQKVWIVQTNGGHDLYESRRFRDTLIAFFDHFVRGLSNGFETRPHAEIWFESTSNGIGHVRQEAVTPGVVATFAPVRPPVATARWWLADGQTLSPTVHLKGHPDAYAYPGHAPTINADEDPDTDRWGPLPADWRTQSLAYTTAPLTERWVTYGSGSADLWVSVNSTDADLQVTLTEVRPDGQEMFVQRGWLRLSDRATDPNRSTPLRPELLDRPEMLQAMSPGQPSLARVELPTFGHIFRPGSRIRLWFETPTATGGYGFAPFSVPTHVTLWHDAEHPSQFVLGRLDQFVAETPRPRCGQVLKQPCRPDPLRTHPPSTHSSH